MSTSWANVTRRIWFEAVTLFLLTVATRIVFAAGALSPYPAVVEVPGGGVLIVWCLNSVLWHWNEFELGERLARLFVGALVGPVIVAEGLIHALQLAPDPGLYGGILAAGLILAGMMEVLLSLFSHNGPSAGT